ncbi:hypothetical protein [Methylobacterium sp. GC_Met_2]|uniref:hypothetical protein n=1 Tax=Methylobacterium sp. GC_Met_2 TaxID=2937376 RepID=UPI00226B37B4|nr:hypothetical protein [Methylobacterium sp. GC_Met_2]
MSFSDDEIEALKIERSVALRPGIEGQWRQLLDRQQKERDTLYGEGLLSMAWRVAMLRRMMQEKAPDTGIGQAFALAQSPKAREEFLGKHQLAERKTLAKAVAQAIAAAHRSIDDLDLR